MLLLHAHAYYHIVTSKFMFISLETEKLQYFSPHHFNFCLKKY